MAERWRFNPSLRMPIIDLLIALILVVATGYFWFQTSGKGRVRDGVDGLRRSRLENRQRITDQRTALEETSQQLGEMRVRRDELAQRVIWLEDQMQLEQDRITEAEELSQAYTDRLLDLRLDLQQIRDQRMAYNTDIFETNGRIDENEMRIAELEAQALERNQEIDRLEVWIAEAEQELDLNPPSRFPERSSLASTLEITDPEERVVVSLASGLKRVGKLDVGLLGSLGLSTNAETSLKEGGLFANLLLAHRRASLDFEGGISQLISRSEDTKDTSPFAGATLRYAPLRRERLFLLAGTRYSHEDIGLRLGLGLGRR